MAEIEHFLDPNDKTHQKFETIADLELQLYSAENQMNSQPAQAVRLRDAVHSKIINSESLAYFLGRIYLFLIKIGIDQKRIRFRQHLKNEMAHYACDCWDAECQLTAGWIECVGCADRSCYDLKQHTKFSGEQLVAKRILPVPKRIQTAERKINQKIIGQVFRKDAATMIKYLEDLSDDAATILHQTLEQENEKIIIVDKEFIITRSMFTFQFVEETIEGKDIISH